MQDRESAGLNPSVGSNDEDFKQLPRNRLRGTLHTDTDMGSSVLTFSKFTTKQNEKYKIWWTIF